MRVKLRSPDGESTIWTDERRAEHLGLGGWEPIGDAPDAPAATAPVPVVSPVVTPVATRLHEDDILRIVAAMPLTVAPEPASAPAPAAVPSRVPPFVTVAAGAAAGGAIVAVLSALLGG